ncbi:hypothetical protein DRE_04286 [Drechslerella stenobrocha 248]|uniref:Zn(2)-C6 fungal-type domain-containing protein n=1 Tax=Drechslerella stenobrocha 248 TaxID=1043628 RepID=W7I327_9PEZI|nr:hypothetical protein DRE_04286 [Drechslerella stenobrocha 248]
MAASTTTSYPPNPPQHDPTFQPINKFHREPHPEFPPLARDSWPEPALGLRNIANGPAPSDPNLHPSIHAKPLPLPSSRRPSLVIETIPSTDTDKTPQQPQPFSGLEKQTSPHAPAATGPPPMQHRPTTVPPMVTAKREPNIQHLPPHTTPPSPSSAPIHYPPPSHPPPPHPLPPLQPAPALHPQPPIGSHPINYPSLQPFAPTGQPNPQMIAPEPPTAPPQAYHHSAPLHMGGYAAQPPNPRRLSVAPGIPESDEMSPMAGTFPYHMSSSTSFPQRRKAVRAAQACDACRTRKAKCDEGRPACSFCKDNNSPCVYREVPPPKQDRTMIMIQERVQNIEQLMLKQQGDLTVVTLLKQILEVVSSKTDEDEDEDAQAREHSAASSPHERKLLDQSVSNIPVDPVGTCPPPHRVPIDTMPLSQVQTPTQPPSNFAVPPAGGIPMAMDSQKEEDNYITIPHKHNTAAHKLLRWRSIRELLSKKYPDNYVMDGELRRGSLRIRGRGEGNPSLDPNVRDGVNGGPQSDNYYHAVVAGSPGVPSMMKGAGGKLGHGQNEILRVDFETSMMLLDNFLNNIYILHPFLRRSRLVEMVQDFSRKHGAGIIEAFQEENALVPGHSISPENSFASMASSAMMDRSHYIGVNQHAQSYNTAPPLLPPAKAGSKRKRDSNVQPGPPPFAQGEPRNFYRQTTPTDLPRQQIPPTLGSAIVLLVLALGAITGHKTPVPGPLPPTPTSNPNYALPDQYQLPPGAQPSPLNYPPNDLLENIDVIPGLAYCNEALKILAVHQGRSEVEYVQAALLAGLYWGQLGRPMDSWQWISSACMACQIMINQRLPADNVNDVLRDTMVTTFWSCVQLESDLLAELDVPRSGITRLEGSELLQMVMQTKVAEDMEIWFYFLSQYHIRKILNQVHSELYKPSSANTSLKTATVLLEELESWRRTLPPNLQWLDSDPPASDINAARLRAKYYGAKYVINRPFVEHFIHRGGNPNAALINPGGMTSPALSQSSVSQGSPSTSVHTPLGLDNRRGSMVGEDAKERFIDPCKTCLDAAVQSTSAFHGFDAMSNRPILTNIFGTAHAQFGNLLVLQAASRHPKLKQFVDKEVLRGLFIKTIRFLRTLSPISPSLAQDVVILEDASSKLDFPA